MENPNSKSNDPRDPDYYKGRYPDRLTPPVKSAADEVTFAVSKELLKKDVGFFGLIDLSPSDQPPDKDYFIKSPNIYVGMSNIRYFKRKDWMLNGSKMTSEELNQIEDAFENFINEVEWEDE
jgi:hypothetical protein